MTAAYELAGSVAPPMLNGELAFDAPWQGRVFGMARGLAERGIFSWDAFRARLIEQVASFDRDLNLNRSFDHGRVAWSMSAPHFHYYDHFLSALETLLVERAIVGQGELREHVHALAERPHGHDHDHHDDHDHHPA